jgi:hypothetical protein
MAKHRNWGLQHKETASQPPIRLSRGAWRVLFILAGFTFAMALEW